MTDAEILDALRAVALESLGWEGELDPSRPLVELLELDSLRLLTFLVELEDRFRVILDPEDEQAVVTAADLVAAIRGKLAGG